MATRHRVAGAPPAMFVATIFTVRLVTYSTMLLAPAHAGAATLPDGFAPPPGFVVDERNSRTYDFNREPMGHAKSGSMQTIQPEGRSETTPTSAFVDNGDGTVTHGTTGLMWKRCPIGATGAQCTVGAANGYSWSAALSLGRTDTTGGYTDWRLPNIKELESIAEYCGTSPALNQAIFPPTVAVSPSFWSSTTDAFTPGNALYVYFFNGNVGTIVKSTFLTVRLVRGGQSWSAYDASHPLLFALDVDANGKADALTDGLLIIRYLFGLTGAPLTNNAVGSGATRSTAAAIQSYLQSMVPK